MAADIRLDDRYQLLPQAGGSPMLTDGSDCLLQELRLEAVTQPGDLFYDADYGWGLMEFCHRAADELTVLEITQRITTKLARRGDIDIQTVRVKVDSRDDSVLVHISFQFIDDAQRHTLDLSIGRVQIEVIAID